MTNHHATNRHRMAGVERDGRELLDAEVVVVAVHGRHQTPGYLREHLAARLDSTLRAGIAWLYPAADANTWYPERFLEPLEANQPDLDHALEILTDIEAMVEHRDPRSVVWVGFSQGACLIAEHIARRPRRWGGVAVLTGGRIGPDGTDFAIDGDLDGMPVYFGAGERDAWVPTARVHATADVYRAAGATVDVDIFADSDHEIRTAEILHVERLITLAARTR